jgi:probable HAF family extracellular repeat protein
MKSLIRGVALASAWVTVSALPGCIQSSCEEKRTCGGYPAPNESDAGSGGELTLLPRSTGGRAGGTGFGLGGGPAATGGATSQGGSAGSEAEPAVTGGESAAGGETAAGGAGDGGEPPVTDAGAAGIEPTACEPNPCAHGTCSPLGASFECACDAGYDGDLCEKNIDDCTPNPCRNGGRCEDGVGEYSCVCDGRFTGDDCELPRFEIIEPEFEYASAAAEAVSGDGRVVVGGLDTLDGNSRAFKWEDGLFELLPPPEGSSWCWAVAVSEDGAQIFGEARFIDENNQQRVRPVRWENATVISLPVLMGSWARSRISAVSPDGSVPVGWSDSSDELASIATFWRNDTAASIDVAPTTRATAASDRGETIVGWSDQDDGFEAFHYSHAELRLLPKPPGHVWCWAVDIDDEGSTILGECWPEVGDGTSAVRWVDGQIEGLGTPSPNVVQSPEMHPRAISGDGTTAVGIAEHDALNHAVPFIWDAQRGMRWLPPILEEVGFDSLRYTWGDPSFPRDVSSDGRVVVGRVTEIEGYRAFIARLP